MIQARVSAKNRDKKVSAAANAAAQADEDAAALAAEAEEEFLLLDGAIISGSHRHIDMNEEASDVAASAQLTIDFGRGFNGGASRGSLGLGSSCILLNVTGGGDLTATPGARKASSSLLARTPLARMGTLGGITIGGGGGSAIGGGISYDSSRAGLGAGGAGIFRLASTPVGRSGALMLGGSWRDATPLPSSAALLDGGEEDMMEAVGGAGPSGPGPTRAPSQGASTIIDGPTPLMAGGEGEDEREGRDDWFYDVTGGGGVGELGADDDHGLPDIDYDLGAGAAAAAPVPAPWGGARSRAAAAASARPALSKRLRPAGGEGASVPIDVWAQLDPAADAGPASHRPFKAGRTYIVLKEPAAVADKGPLAAAAEAMERTARSTAKGGMGAREARALLAHARVVLARAGSSSHGGERPLLSTLDPRPCALLPLPPPAPVGPPPATRAAARIAEIHAHTAHLAALFTATLPVTYPDIEALAISQKAVTVRLRLAARRSGHGLGRRAGAAGEAYAPELQAGEEGGGGREEGAGEEEGGRGWMGPGAGQEDDEGARHTRPGDEVLQFDDEDQGMPDVDYDLGGGGGGGASTGGARFGGAGEDVGQDVITFLEEGAAADAAHAASRARRVALVMDARIAEALGEGARPGAREHEDEAYWRDVRDKIARYAEGADKWLSRTAMSRRVDKWTHALDPVLAAEDARPEFDIHGLGAAVLCSLPGKRAVKADVDVEEVETEEEEEGPPVPATPLSFLDIVSASTAGPSSSAAAPRPVQPYEVARLFLATLQLAVAGNVDILTTAATPAPAPASGKGTGGTAKGKAKALGAPSSEDGWLASQVVPYGEDEEAMEAVAEANKGVAAARGVRLAAGFAGVGRGLSELFSVRFLHSRLIRPEMEMPGGFGGAAEAPEGGKGGGKRGGGSKASGKAFARGAGASPAAKRGRAGSAK